MINVRRNLILLTPMAWWEDDHTCNDFSK